MNFIIIIIRVHFQRTHTEPFHMFSYYTKRHKNVHISVNKNIDFNIKNLFLFSSFEGTVRPDWLCMRVVPLDSPLKGHQLLYVQKKIIFDLEYLIRVQSSEPLYAKMNSTSCLFGSRSVQNPVFLFAGALSFDEKFAIVQLYFGKDKMVRIWPTF